jgi:hypothetical protein
MAKNATENPMKLPEGSKGNYDLRSDNATAKTSFTFPENAEMTGGKCKFRTPEDLLKYLEASVGVVSAKKAMATVSPKAVK